MVRNRRADILFVLQVTTNILTIITLVYRVKEIFKSEAEKRKREEDRKLYEKEYEEQVRKMREAAGMA